MRKNLKAKLTVAVVCAVTGVLLALFPLGNALVFLGYDLLFVFKPDTHIKDCLIVEMDEKSYQELNQVWGQTWDRNQHARLLNKLSTDRAKLVVFDVTFLEATTEEADQNLAEAIRANGRVVLAADSEPINSQGVVGSEVRQPLGLLATNALGWGLADVDRDTDLTVRRFYPGTDHHASLAWSAASAMQAFVTQKPNQRLEERWINYYGPSHTVPTISYSDALTAGEGYFSNRVVFIGGRPKTRFVGDEIDEFSTPFTRWDGKGSGGVEVMATSTMNLARGDWLVRFPVWLESLAVIAVGAALGFGLRSTRPLGAFAIAVGVATSVFVLALAILWFAHTWFAWGVMVFAQIPLAWIISVAARRSQPSVQEEQLPHLEAAPHPVSDLGASMPISSVTTSNTVAAGAVVADHKLLRLIGEGGYGQVWLCQNAVGIYRAAKIVYRAKFIEAEPYQREFRGVQNFMRLNHPRLLRIFHIGPNSPDELFYYIMELGDDEQSGRQMDTDKYAPRTLSRDLRRVGRLPVADCVALGLSIAEGLDYLHSQNLIHRDIKPSNVIYVDSVAKLADIGLVADPETTDLSLVGTRDYMDPYFPSTVAGDVYGLGKVLYVAMTGLNPGHFPELPTGEPTSPGRIEMEMLLKILAKACTSNRRERYASVALMRADLEELRNSQVTFSTDRT